MSKKISKNVVIFEVEPQNNKKATYLNIAQQLLVDLEKIEGFISVERFESLTNPGKLLSLSTWQDEASIARWRNQVSHKKAQEAGRSELFSQYRISFLTAIWPSHYCDKVMAL